MDHESIKRVIHHDRMANGQWRLCIIFCLTKILHIETKYELPERSVAIAGNRDCVSRNLRGSYPEDKDVTRSTTMKTISSEKPYNIAGSSYDSMH